MGWVRVQRMPWLWRRRPVIVDQAGGRGAGPMPGPAAPTAAGCVPLGRPWPQRGEGVAVAGDDHGPAVTLEDRAAGVQVLRSGSLLPGGILPDHGVVLIPGRDVDEHNRRECAARTGSGEHPGPCRLGGSEDRHEHPVASEVSQVTSAGDRRARGCRTGRRAGVAGGHHGERVQQRGGAAGRVTRPARTRCGRHTGYATVTDQVDQVIALGEMHRDRARGADRPLERGGRPLASPGRGAGVEQHGRAGRAGALLPAHHQLTGAGAGSPVDPSQVVPGLVRAGDEVVGPHGGPVALAEVADHGLSAGARRGQCFHRRGDDKLAAAAERAGELAQPERIRDPDRHRPDQVTAAQLGAKLIGEVPGAPRLHPVEHEARPEAEMGGDVVIHQQHRGGTPTHVVDPNADRHHRPHGRAGGYQAPVTGEPVAGPAHERRRAHRQGEQQQADPQEVLLADHDRQPAADQPGDHETLSADGQTS